MSNSKEPIPGELDAIIQASAVFVWGTAPEE